MGLSHHQPLKPACSLELPNLAAGLLGTSKDLLEQEGTNVHAHHQTIHVRGEEQICQCLTHTSTTSQANVCKRFTGGCISAERMEKWSGMKWSWYLPGMLI